MVATQDCKNFIAKFIQDNPSLVISIYGKEYCNEEMPELIADATNPKKWKRLYKCKPGNGDYEFDEYSLFDRNIHVAQMGYGRMKTRPATEFVSERGFILDEDKYDTGVAFAIVEDKEGNLHLADYIGD